MPDNALGRLGHWFGTDADFEQPRPRVGLSDVIFTIVAFVALAVARELQRPIDTGFRPEQHAWVEYLTIVSFLPLLVLRRRWPGWCACLGFAHFFVATTWVPIIGFGAIYQFTVFMLIYSVAAWSQNRQLGLLLILGLTLFLFLWLSWDIVLGSAIDDMHEAIDQGKVETRPSLLPPVVSTVLLQYLLNTLYMAGAIFLGRNAWWQARDRHWLAEQTATIAQQSAELRQQAVTQERLRIARELHDVVAHHLSVMGIQAGAARMMLTKDIDQASESLRTVEESSRAAVGEMRGLLGALRQAEQDPSPRAPEPSLEQLPELFAQLKESAGLQVTYTEALDTPNALAQVPLPIQLSLHRTIQEALTNVCRHSTAKSARVVLRTDRSSQPNGWVEVEILDDGRPIPSTSGTGLGIMGIRERVVSHQGTADIGPRRTVGYRVRVRLPLQPQGEL